MYCWYTGKKLVPGTFTGEDHIKNYTSTVLMLNQRVTWDGEKWTYSPSKYWPLKDDEMLTFRAYAPYVSYNLQTDKYGMPLLPVVVDKDDYHNGTQHDPLWGTGKLVQTAGVNAGEYYPLPDPATEESLKAYYRYGTHYDNITYKMSGDWRDKPTDHDPADTRNG